MLRVGSELCRTAVWDYFESILGDEVWTIFPRNLVIAIKRSDEDALSSRNEVWSRPRTQASSRYPSYQRRLGTECDSVLGELSRQAWQVTSYPKSPRTTGNEAGVIPFFDLLLKLRQLSHKFTLACYLCWTANILERTEKIKGSVQEIKAKWQWI